MKTPSKHRVYEKEIEKLKKASHAGTVLVSAAEIDSALRNLLLCKMRKLSIKKAQRIFGSCGPLDHFSPKIDIAYALELFEDGLYNDLQIIKNIRNEFAHPKGWTDFRTPAVAELVRQFKGWNSSCDPSELFTTRVKICLERIDAKLEKALFDSAMSDKPG
jgi:DNA-binding MltR family transcriptional regulator